MEATQEAQAIAKSNETASQLGALFVRGGGTTPVATTRCPLSSLLRKRHRRPLVIGTGLEVDRIQLHNLPKHFTPAHRQTLLWDTSALLRLSPVARRYDLVTNESTIYMNDLVSDSSDEWSATPPSLHSNIGSVSNRRQREQQVSLAKGHKGTDTTFQMSELSPKLNGYAWKCEPCCKISKPSQGRD